MLIPCNPPGHASEFVTVTNLSEFGYFPAEKEMKTVPFSGGALYIHVVFYKHKSFFNLITHTQKKIAI